MGRREGVVADEAMGRFGQATLYLEIADDQVNELPFVNIRCTSPSRPCSQKYAVMSEDER